MKLAAYGKAMFVAFWLALLTVTPAASGEAPATPEAYDRLPLADLVPKARNNDVSAQFELGSRFNYGRGVPKNTAEALRWLRQAAQRGHTEAQRLLALKFYHGYDVPADLGEALQWAQRLAEAGDVRAQMMLAAMYANGEGGPRQLVRAHAWYAIAAAGAWQADEAGDAAMREMRTAAEAQRDYVATLLLPGEEAEAQQMASDWWLRRAKVKLPAPPPPAAGATAAPR